MGFSLILNTFWMGINEIQCWPFFFPRQALLTICGPSKVSTKWRRLDLREMLKVYWGICRIWKGVGRLQSGNMFSDDHYHHIRYYQAMLVCYTTCLSYVYTYADVILSNGIWKSPPAFFSNFSGLMGQSLWVINLSSCFAKAALHIIAGQLSEEKIKAYAGWIDECELMMRFASRSYDFGAHAARW